MMSATWMWVVGLVLALGLLIWTPTRQLLTGLVSTFLTPAFLGFLRASWLWLFWLVKQIVIAHQTLAKNLLTPRRIIFPSIETDRDKKKRQGS